MTERPPYDYDPLPSRAQWSWPGDRRLAVYVALGVEAYRFGEGQTEDLLPGVPAPDRVNTAWRDYGNRVGAFRVLDRFSDLGIPPTLLLNTDVYDEAPEVVDAARKLGAEVVAHGRSNSDSLAGMSVEQERRYLAEVAARIETEEGTAPGGWSSPWLTQTPATLGALAATGYRYLLDLRADDQPWWLRTPAGPLLAVPYPLELNDSTTMIGRQVTASEFADMVVDEFDELLAAAAHQPLVLGIVLHSFISGTPFRLRRLASALHHVANAGGDAVWLTRPGEIAAAYTAAVPPPPVSAPGGG